MRFWFHRHYFLGQAASYSWGDVFRHLFAVGLPRDCERLEQYLVKRYKGQEAILCKNGRSALSMALSAYFKPGDAVIVNGFTCYAVYEAVVAAELKPVFADINREDLNFDVETLGKAFRKGVKGIIIQNSLGNPVDIRKIEKFAKEHELVIIEDLAHCTGVKYADGRECGTVGAAAALSFGKDKSIDTISGGAVVFRDEAFAGAEGFRSAAARDGARSPRGNGRERRGPKLGKSSSFKPPRPSDHLRARFYPLFGMISRGLSYVHLGGAFMSLLVKIHWVEKSADNRLDLTRRISRFEAKLALKQFENLRRNGESPIREFCFVDDRNTVLKELAKAGYYFDGLWYKQPVSPWRYYEKVNFPEKDCPNSVFVAEHIINFPTYYTRSALKKAREITKNHPVKEENE